MHNMAADTHSFLAVIKKAAVTASVGRCRTGEGPRKQPEVHIWKQLNSSMVTLAVFKILVLPHKSLEYVLCTLTCSGVIF